jgi:hypothetical protein
MSGVTEEAIVELIGLGWMVVAFGYLGLAAIRNGVDSREELGDDHQRPLIDGGHRA